MLDSGCSSFQNYSKRIILKITFELQSILLVFFVASLDSHQVNSHLVN
jgi:hypothetical protein